MPELPEVETARRGLEPFLTGRTIVKTDINRPDLRVPFPEGLAKSLKGRVVERLSRRAKYILFHLAGGGVLVIHLGMSGRVSVDVTGKKPRLTHDHFVLHLENGAAMVFNDARRFGFVLYFEDEAALSHHPSFKGMGPEPLGDDFTGAVLLAALQGRTPAIKQALLDQKIVAGIGNIYASEALFEAKISPVRPAGTLNRKEADRLVSALKNVLERAITSGGSTLRDFRHADGSSGYFQHHFSVYEKDGAACPSCPPVGKKDSTIRKIVQGGRSTYYCPLCQT